MSTVYFTKTTTEVNKIAAYTAAVQAQALTDLTLATTTIAVTAISTATLAKLAKLPTQLATISARATGDQTATLAAYQAQIALLQPLLVAPTNLASVLTWITSAIAMISGPATKYVAQEVVVTAQALALITAVTNMTTTVATAVSAVNSAVSARLKALGA